MIVAGAGDAGAQQSLPPIDGAQHRRAEDQELHVVVRRVAGAEQVVAELVGQRPVVLTGSVDAGKRLLVQQGGQARFGAIFFNISIVIIWMIDGEVRSRRPERFRMTRARLRCAAS